MQHIFQAGTDPQKPVLLLLHGTGGNEESLLALADMVDPTASVLSVRGNVLENGMPRFFRRLAEGIFDEEDLIARTAQLNQFLDQAAQDYAFNRQNIIAIGYSNGANIAASLLYHYGNALRGAILHHPMVPRRGIALPDLTASPIFIAAGANDPLCPPNEVLELEQTFIHAQADVTVHWESFGHQLTQSEVAAAKQWYEQKI